MKGSSGCRDNVIIEDDLVCFNPNKGAVVCVRHEPGGCWQIQIVHTLGAWISFFLPC